MADVINVVKRNGRGKEPLNIEKIHEMVEYACEDVSIASTQNKIIHNFMIYYNKRYSTNLIKSFRFNFIRYT